jgi:hypothetical protein
MSDASSQLRSLYLDCRLKGIAVDSRVSAIAIRAVGDYSGIRSQYVNDIREAMINYGLGYAGLAVSKGQFKRAMATAFVDGFETGWLSGAGGDTYEPASEDTQWLADRTNQELIYIDGLFQSLKDLIAETTDEEPVTQQDILNFAQSHANGYGNTLDGVFAQGKVRGAKNKMLTFGGPNGSPDNICQRTGGTCVRLMGQRHRASWWKNHDLIPYPGNPNYDCGAYECKHRLKSDSGEIYAGPQE